MTLSRFAEDKKASFWRYFSVKRNKPVQASWPTYQNSDNCQQSLLSAGPLASHLQARRPHRLLWINFLSIKGQKWSHHFPFVHPSSVGPTWLKNIIGAQWWISRTFTLQRFHISWFKTCLKPKSCWIWHWSKECATEITTTVHKNSMWTISDLPLFTGVQCWGIVHLPSAWLLWETRLFGSWGLTYNVGVTDIKCKGGSMCADYMVR